MRRFFLLSLLSLSLTALARIVTISNVEPRVTANGEIADAHDSKVTFFDGVFYWFAASYGACKEPLGANGCANVSIPGACGFRFDHNVSLFTSTDLVHWSDPTVVFSATELGIPGAIVYAPKVIRNPTSGRWILYLNWVTRAADTRIYLWNQSYYAVADAPVPAGPFALRTLRVNTALLTVGDLNLLADGPDAYIIYTGHLAPQYAPERFLMTVEKLTDDWLDSRGAAASSGPIDSHFLSVEAPMLIRHNGSYHAVYGRTCCFCADGTKSLTQYTARSPLGPYKRVALVDTNNGTLSAQSTDLFSYDSGGGALAYMYVGDAWQSAPDGVKGHDFTRWLPLEFDTNGTIRPLRNVATFNITLP